MPLWAGLPARSIVSAAMLVACTGALTVLAAAAFGTAGVHTATLVLLQLSGVLALAVFSGNSGIISFGHSAFMGIGAYVSGILTMSKGIQASALPNLPAWLQHHELPLLAALAAAIAAGLAAGVLTGYPLSRLSSGTAAIGTLAFLIVIHTILIGARDFTRGSQTFYGVPRLTTLTAAFAVAALFIVIARVFRDLPLGLKLRASRDNEVAAAASGVDVRSARFRSWVLSIAMASVAGALYGHFLGAFSPKDFYFELIFTLIAMSIVGGMMTVTGAIAGTVLLSAVVQLLRQAETGLDLGFAQVPGVFGLPQLGMGFALLLTIWRRPLGLMGLSELGPEWFSRRWIAAPAAPPAIAEKRAAAQGSLSVSAVSMRFGGLAALEDVSFDAASRKVTGLIGPNGAGKTTLIDIVSGRMAPSGGRVRIGGRDVARAAAHDVAILGLGRTFQNVRLFDRMTALENVTVAALAKGRSLAAARALALAQLARFGLLDRQDVLAGAFAYGTRRRLEIARALALTPSFLLLDEPAAGMNPAETDDLVRVLERLRAEGDLGLLVVEHDMRLIMRLCDHIVVLNKGQKIAEGTPADIRGNPSVIEAYIGTRRRARTGPAALASP